MVNSCFMNLYNDQSNCCAVIDYANISEADDGSIGVPYSEDYGDIYHSQQGALKQAEFVFLKGNNLPGRWEKCDFFTILETGFGLGLNFLTTWSAWRKRHHKGGRQLHFISVENRWLRKEQFARIHQRWPELAHLSSKLEEVWPLNLSGMHQLTFDHGSVILTLILGDARPGLANLIAQVDAFYLDGFSPSKNPSIWSTRVFQELCRLSKPGATLATWSVSRQVREGLISVGFDIYKTVGFGQKKQMLIANRPGPWQGSMLARKKVAVIGAGLAGSACAQSLDQLGAAVTVFDAATLPAQGASGNFSGVFRPLPNLSHDARAQLIQAAFYDTVRELKAYSPDLVDHALCGVLHLAKDVRSAQRQQACIERFRLPEEMVSFRAPDSLKNKGANQFGGWWFPEGGWVDPRMLCQVRLSQVDLQLGARVGRVCQVEGQWQVFDENKMLSGCFDEVVLTHAAGLLANCFLSLPSVQASAKLLRASRGVICAYPGKLVDLSYVLAKHGYVTPYLSGHAAQVFGANQQLDQMSLEIQNQDLLENIRRLQSTLSGMVSVEFLSESRLSARAGVRPLSRDKMPLVGKLEEGLWMLNGLGSRGIVLSGLCGKLLASQMMGRPWPISQRLAQVLNPLRWADRE